jgi:hypothetical protein
LGRGRARATIVASESRAFLAYYESETCARPDHDEVRLIELVDCVAVRQGPPTDETLHGHPLWDRGLTFYQLHEIENSGWLTSLRDMNRVHPGSPDLPWPDARHYLFAFHDSTVDAVASDVAVREAFPSRLRWRSQRQRVDCCAGMRTDATPASSPHSCQTKVSAAHVKSRACPIRLRTPEALLTCVVVAGQSSGEGDGACRGSAANSSSRGGWSAIIAFRLVARRERRPGAARSPGPRAEGAP